MTVNRDHYKTWYRYLPPWECPSCGKGHLIKVPDKDFVKETGPSKRARDSDDGSDPEWIVERFVMLLQCNFTNCGEVVSLSGNAGIEHEQFVDEEGQWQQDYVRLYEILSLLPAPLPIRPSEKTPEKVQEALRMAGQLIWQSPEAAANHIRQAVEHLMDSQKIKKGPKSGKGKLNLHARLLLFEKKDALNGQILRAIKWIGNDGSHMGGVSRDDVLDAFDMMELALTNLYDDTTKQLMKKVSAIIKAKEKAPKPKPQAAMSAKVATGTAAAKPAS